MQAKTLQEQLNVSLAVVERLEAAAEETKSEYAAMRAKLEAALEEAQVSCSGELCSGHLGDLVVTSER